MKITLTEMDQIHGIQIGIFKEVIRVCQQLGLEYYMVHGSLLGTVMTGRFMPLDDDIDIAMPRSDFNKLIKEGPNQISNQYFIQYHTTDPQYPMAFAKVRDNSTTYVVDTVRHLDINHGIYIDIFPIDFHEENRIKNSIYSIIKRVLNWRISANFYFETKSIKHQILFTLATALCPSWEKAMQWRNQLNQVVRHSSKVTITGGKSSEVGIDTHIFNDAEIMCFEGINVKVPSGYVQYLKTIYGDYKNRTLLENKEHDDFHVEINAVVLDFEKSYDLYRKETSI